MQKFARDVPANVGVTIPQMSSASNLCACADQSIDLAVTSPPYLNAVDYPRTHQLETYWLGLASGSLRDLKAQHIGTEVVSSRDCKRLHATGYDCADAVIASIYQKDPRRAYHCLQVLGRYGRAI